MMRLFKLAIMLVCMSAMGCMTNPTHFEETGEDANSLTVSGYASTAGATVAVYAYHMDTPHIAQQVGTTTAATTGTTWDGLTGYAYSVDVDVSNFVKCVDNSSGYVYVYTRLQSSATKFKTFNTSPTFSQCWFGDGNENWGDFLSECTRSTAALVRVNLANCYSN